MMSPRKSTPSPMRLDQRAMLARRRMNASLTVIRMMSAPCSVVLCTAYCVKRKRNTQYAVLLPLYVLRFTFYAFVSLLVPPQHQAGILAAQAKRIRQGDAHVRVAGHVGHVIQVASGIRGMLVDGRMDDPGPQRLN